jgi:hypothetical protein
LSGALSTCGRRTNQKALGVKTNACTDASTALAKRFVHFEAYNVSVNDVIAALAEAIPKQ